MPLPPDYDERMHPVYLEFFETEKVRWSKGTIRNYSFFLTRLPDPEELTPDWVKGFLKGKSPSSKSTYMSMLSKIGTELGINCLEGIKWPKLQKKTKIQRKHLITAEKFQELLSVAYDIRDQGLLEFALESGGRRDEICEVHVDDFIFEQHGLAYVTLDGKTGMREIPLFECVPRIKQLLEIHPTGEGHLFRSLKNPKHPIGHQGLYWTMRKLFDRASFPQPPSPVHIFRHTRATELATMLTEAEMCEFFGWEQGSDQPQRYIHLAGADLKKSFKRKVLGLTPDEPDQILQAKTCPSCRHRNTSTAKICESCGLVMDIQLAMRMRKDDDMRDQIAKSLMKGEITHPEIRQIFQEELRELLKDPENLKRFLALASHE